MKARFAAGIALSLLFCIFAVIGISAATLVVTKTDDTDDGICDADCSLREAIRVAAPNDTVIFSALFNSTQTITLGLGQIEIDKPVTITGPGSGFLDISGNNANRILHIHSAGNVFFTGMTLRNAQLIAINFGTGGAILMSQSNLTLTDVVLRNNAVGVYPPGGQTGTGYGGAIYSSNSTLSLINSTISNNFLPGWPNHGSGGGIYANGSTDIYIVGSVLSGNREGALVGGRIVSLIDSVIKDNRGQTAPANGTGVSGSRVTATNSRITDNNGVGIGGGTTLTIDRCIITGNEGGGVSNGGLGTITNTVIHENSDNGLPWNISGGVHNGGTLYITNTSITNNTASVSGGGIYNSGDLFLTNSSVIDNVSTHGAGIYNNNSSGEYVLVTNSTIAGNEVDHAGAGAVIFRNSIITNVFGSIISQGNNLLRNSFGSSGWISTDLINADPRLAPLGNNGSSTFTRALLPGSPAINAGNNSLAIDPQTNLPLTTDQRGYDRVGGGTVDIGAYESNYSPGPLWFNGRVLNLGGRGISNTRITLSDGATTLYSQTNPFGYFRFPNLTPGTTYTIAIMHKYYMFDSPQLVTVDNTALNFTAR